MKLAAALVLSCVFATTGCQYDPYEPTEHFKTLNASFNRLAHKKVGTTEMLATARPDRYELVMKRSEYLNRQARSPNDAKGDEYCEDFAIIQAIDVPYGGFIIPYSKTDVIDGTRMALADSFIIPNTERETMLAIPDELPGPPGLEKPFKIEQRIMRQCFYRPEGTVLE